MSSTPLLGKELSIVFDESTDVNNQRITNISIKPSKGAFYDDNFKHGGETLTGERISETLFSQILRICNEPDELSPVCSSRNFDRLSLQILAYTTRNSAQTSREILSKAKEIGVGPEILDLKDLNSFIELSQMKFSGFRFVNSLEFFVLLLRRS
ncbi:uncharacterized protein Z518_06114 [Rhinocladiella mackenziei CBS 650.93]|uniref:Uncharacterized protein n=1 Tax=Rhinocladiella mackenziei CBS 650.93 TaxID=1442369 RepID=A0A0D2FSZ9_9EURO|nr:uncharacterized protein Z518_06114 [Rhinocladiella mackenziei CBS 650.93]KIX05242.1 hypothetical protein Z518_06114 [Rhinocladiella mackenziei CBS 650.93]